MNCQGTVNLLTCACACTYVYMHTYCERFSWCIDFCVFFKDGYELQKLEIDSVNVLHVYEHLYNIQ